MSDYNKTVENASTFHEPNTVDCENATLTVRVASTLTFADFHCSGTCTIHVNDASTLIISSGQINLINGDVTGCSTAICRAGYSAEEVSVSGGSTFSTA